MAGLHEMLLCLSPHSHDDIHSDESVGHAGLDAFHLPGKERCVIPAVHDAQHLVGSALQWYVEMRHEGPALRTPLDEFVGEEVGFEAADSVSVDTLHLVERLDEVDEVFARVFSEISNVDPGDDDFLSSFFGSLPCLFHQRFNPCTAAESPGMGDGAISAEIVAPVLHLAEEPGAVPSRTPGSESCDVLCFHGMVPVESFTILLFHPCF